MQQLVAVLNAQESRIDSREHLQDAGQPRHLPLGKSARAAQLSLRERTLYGRYQPLRIAFQNVIGRSTLQRFDGKFFADCPRQKNKRDIGRLHARNGQSRHPTESGQTEIRQDEIRRPGSQRASHVLLIRHAPVGAPESRRLQSPDRQLRVRLGIFDQ